MKISAMLEREDFYSILERTLNKYGFEAGISPGTVKIKEDKKDCVLYVNPQLNAIIAPHPSPAVKDFLKTEYNVSGGIHKRMAVKSYLWVSTHFVKNISNKGIQLAYDGDTRDLLIYPCNKKIRLFDFKQGIVHTILKDGFPDNYIRREVEFRQKRIKEFVPSIEKSRDRYYSERIINGRPLARINETSFVESNKRKAYEMILSLTPEGNVIDTNEYLERLAEECGNLLAQKPEYGYMETVYKIFEYLKHECPHARIPIVTSHGDLQPGNIWIDDEQNRLIIIDWETVKQRSIFYDFAALYLDMRSTFSKPRLYERILTDFPTSNYDTPIKAIALTVLAEELAYQTEELASFPNGIGIKEYNQIIEQYTHLKL